MGQSFLIIINNAFAFSCIKVQNIKFFKNWDKFALHRLAPLPEIVGILFELFNRFKNPNFSALGKENFLIWAY